MDFMFSVMSSFIGSFFQVIQAGPWLYVHRVRTSSGNTCLRRLLVILDISSSGWDHAQIGANDNPMVAQSCPTHTSPRIKSVLPHIRLTQVAPQTKPLLEPISRCIYDILLLALHQFRHLYLCFRKSSWFIRSSGIDNNAIDFSDHLYQSCSQISTENSLNFVGIK